MSDVNFIFVRDENNFPVGCFAYRNTETGIEYGYSIFYMGGVDIFNRAMGRSIAQGRLEKSPSEVRTSGSSNQLVVEMLKHAHNVGFHQWSLREDFMPRPLGHRFRYACKRTTEKLLATIKRKQTAA